MVGFNRLSRPRGRHSVYVVVVGLILLAGLVVAVRSGLSPQPPPAWVGRATLAFTVCAMAGLIALDARPIPYGIGVACLSIALIAMWLGSPDGDAWRSVLLAPIGAATYPRDLILLVSIISFTSAWLLLARSVTGWLQAATSYLGVGLVFTLLHTSVLGERFVVPLVLQLLAWPFLALNLLGVFGRVVPS